MARVGIFYSFFPPHSRRASRVPGTALGLGRSAAHQANLLSLGAPLLQLRMLPGSGV